MESVELLKTSGFYRDGRVTVNTDPVSIPDEESHHPELLAGGHFKPHDCLARHKVAVITPYRDREEHLDTNRFNRAQLMNIGAIEGSKLYQFDCYIFHDVDHVPEDDRNIYSCPKEPRHMSLTLDKRHYKPWYKRYFGGVSAMSTEDFEKVNGFSNRFWGWGSEDDDMFDRIKHHGLSVTRYNIGIARYKMLPHKHATPNPDRRKIRKEGLKKLSTEGLSNCRYNVKKIEKKILYTWIKVELLKS